jgi:hypothetical protein
VQALSLAKECYVMRLDETDLLQANKINVFGTAQGLINIDLESTKWIYKLE